MPRPTVTPTPTITPTATPTWGQARCEAKGGYWALTQLTGADAYGCWFSTSIFRDLHGGMSKLEPVVNLYAEGLGRRHIV
ncbi:MAG: hypothetical protein NTZ78_09310 [Candidatus Aureabacteria bacterium]|nr:hypothetical protein [Candidatus Auribacterota bacterium]